MVTHSGLEEREPASEVYFFRKQQHVTSLFCFSVFFPKRLHTIHTIQRFSWLAFIAEVLHFGFGYFGAGASAGWAPLRFRRDGKQTMSSPMEHKDSDPRVGDRDAHLPMSIFHMTIAQRSRSNQ